VSSPGGRHQRAWKVVLGTILGMALVVGSALYFYSTELPRPTGPFPVGRACYAWTDRSRQEPWIDNPSERRQLLAYVWYPAPPVGPEAPYFPGLAQLSDQFRWYERFVLRSARSRVRAAPAVAPGSEKYPVLLFSPGANNSSLFYNSLLAELASHGFVVVGMEHTHEGRGQVLPDGTVIAPDAERYRPRSDSPTRPAEEASFYRKRVDVRSRDAVFVLDQLTWLDENDPLLVGVSTSRGWVFSVIPLAASQPGRPPDWTPVSVRW